jgi:hypothetical protein
MAKRDFVTIEASQSAQSSSLLKEDRMEEERMRDISLLLTCLVQREEASVKLILDCLYDIGSKNIINKKVRYPLFNKFMKAIARMSKPAFKYYALRWFKKNCPTLIADWLHSQVKF